MRQGHINLKRIAQKAGVDVSTVSRALNNDPRVKSDTVTYIKEMADEMGYFPNALARSLVTKKTNTIGVVTPSLRNPFYSSILAGAEERLAKAGYSLLLGVSHYLTKDEKQVIDLFLSWKVDGMIVLSGTDSEFASVWRRHSDAPIVLVDQYNDVAMLDSIMCDIGYGVKLVVEYLAGLGHRQIGYVTDTITDIKRLDYFKKEAEQLEIDYTGFSITTEKQYEEGGYEATLGLLKRRNMPTALFYANDYMAIGGMKALHDNKLSVPNDISVVGYDDSVLLDYLINSLTTVRQPTKLLGTRSADILLERLSDGGGGPYQKVLLLPELVLRGSTGPHIAK